MRNATPLARSAEPLARGLGWFSLGLGLAELAMARSMAQGIGLDRSAGVIRAYGVREIANGAAILLADDPTPWIWTRIAGDGLDMATVAPGVGQSNPRRLNAILSLAMLAGVTALDVICAKALEERRQRRATTRDYSNRSGFPRGAEQMRGAARDFQTPRDMRAPEAMRPFTDWQRPSGDQHRVEPATRRV